MERLAALMEVSPHTLDQVEAGKGEPTLEFAWKIANALDVRFATGSDKLTDEARDTVDRIGKALGSDQLSHFRFLVEGHTDSVGGDELNQRLSEQRADSVRTYLISQGVQSDAVTSRGFGKSKPVADNNTAAGRQVNRRVELVVNGPLLSKESPILSTGQRRRLLLARALARRPRLLLLDEITANLDPQTEEKIIAGLRGFPAAKIFVTHSERLLGQVHRVYRTGNGRLSTVVGTRPALSA